MTSSLPYKCMSVPELTSVSTCAGPIRHALDADQGRGRCPQHKDRPTSSKLAPYLMPDRCL